MALRLLQSLHLDQAGILHPRDLNALIVGPRVDDVTLILSKGVPHTLVTTAAGEIIAARNVGRLRIVLLHGIDVNGVSDYFKSYHLMELITR